MSFKINKETKILIIIIAIALLLRIPNLDQIYFGDETYTPNLLQYQIQNGFSIMHETYRHTQRVVEYWGDLPLTEMIYTGWALLVGLSTVKLRSLSLIFGIVNMLLTYVVARKLFGKRTALFSTGLMAICYWHIFASYMVERDSSFMMFFYLISVLLYLKFKETSKQKFVYFIAIIISLAFLMKVSAVFIAGVVGLMYLFDIGKNPLKYGKKDILGIMKFSLPIVIICSVVYLGFVAYIYKYIPGYYETMFSHAVPTQLFAIPGIAAVARELGYLVLWGSPLIAGLFVLSAAKYTKQLKYMLIWFGVVFAGYSFTVHAGSIDRYVAVWIPAICIATGYYLSKIKFDLKNTLVIGAFAVLNLILMNILSLRQKDYIAHSLKGYALRGLALNWNFYFPMYGAGGPFYLVAFSALAVGMVLCVVSFIYLLFNTKKNTANLALCMFFGLSLGFSLFMIQEFTLHIHAPNVSEATYDAINYLRTNYVMKPYDKVYTNSFGVPLYIDVKRTVWVRCKTEECWNETERVMKANSGPFIFIDIPKYPEGHRIRETLKSCYFVKSFDDLDIVQIYWCDKEIEKTK